MSARVFIILIIFFLTEPIHPVKSLNILGIFPYQGKSHFFVFEPFLKELAVRGHNITVISYFPLKEPLKNYNDVSLQGKINAFESVFPLERSYKTLFDIGNFLMKTAADNCVSLCENQNVHDLLKSGIKFDVTVLEQFNSDCSLGIAYKFGAPVIGMTSHTPMPWHFERFGIPNNPSFVSFQFTEGGTKPTLYERVERTVLRFIINYLFTTRSQSVDQQTLAKYFDDVPPLEELGREIKLLLLYTSPLLFGSSLFPANVIEVNGYHVAKPRPLPSNIHKFIDESEHGVILVSFGSMLQTKSTPLSLLEAITSALSELPQRVIFKWDDDKLPGNPKNILISKWLPQNDILAQPNVVAFFSHCGLLSTTEAIHHGVPIIGMPVFGDQPANAAAIEESGFGVIIPIADVTKENLLDKFKIALDPKFRENVKQRSEALHDRPVSAMDTAIFWTEYVARHKNITLRAAVVDVPFYQYFCLDIIAVLLLIVISLLFIVKLVIKFILQIILPQNKSKQSKKKRQ